MSQKTNSMIKLALVFFISLLSFSIGTYVGKKYSDNQHKLALLEPQKNDVHDSASTEFAAHSESGPAKPASDPQSLTDSEVAKIAEEFASEQSGNGDLAADEKSIQTAEEDSKEIKSISAKPVKQPKVLAQAPKTLPVKTVPVKTLTQAAAEQVARMETEQRVPASQKTIKDSNSMHFTVQVGSFPTEGEAQKTTKELLAKGFKTSYTPAQVNGQTWYRVNVGLFGSVKEAQDYKKDFMEKTKLTSAIVQKVQSSN